MRGPRNMPKELTAQELQEIQVCRRGLPLLTSKNRTCLKCGHVFLSMHAGHRQCVECASYNQRFRSSFADQDPANRRQY